MLQPLPAPVAAAATPGSARVATIARMATWRDLGAGAGPLFAGIVLPFAPRGLYLAAALVFAISTLALAILGVSRWRRAR